MHDGDGFSLLLMCTLLLNICVVCATRRMFLSSFTFMCGYAHTACSLTSADVSLDCDAMYSHVSPKVIKYNNLFEIESKTERTSNGQSHGSERLPVIKMALIVLPHQTTSRFITAMKSKVRSFAIYRLKFLFNIIHQSLWTMLCTNMPDIYANILSAAIPPIFRYVFFF